MAKNASQPGRNDPAIVKRDQQASWPPRFIRHHWAHHSTLHSPFTTHHSPLTTHHSPLPPAHHSSLITHHSSLITHYSPLTTHHASRYSVTISSREGTRGLFCGLPDPRAASAMASSLASNTARSTRAASRKRPIPQIAVQLFQVADQVLPCLLVAILSPRPCP